MQCAARLVQIWRQKNKNAGSASDFRKNPYFIEEARRFFSQSHHDPQDSRLKIFSGLGFGGPPTFFARANFNRYRNEVKIKFLCFQRFHEIFPKLSSDLRWNSGKFLENVWCCVLLSHYKNSNVATSEIFWPNCEYTKVHVAHHDWFSEKLGKRIRKKSPSWIKLWSSICIWMVVTVPIGRMISAKNARAWVSMDLI